MSEDLPGDKPSIDVNETPVGAISDADATANAVDENLAGGTVVGITALATDPDGGDTVTYSLSNDAGGLFAIDANTGVVTTTGSLDAETASSYNIEVTATSSDSSTSVQTFTINVNDSDNTEFSVGAISDSDGGADTVSEAAIVGTAVGVTAFATDADASDTVTYSLSSNPGGLFAIDANSGIVTVAAGIDYETATSHGIEVTATSTDGSTSVQTFNIAVSDDTSEASVSAISDTDASANAVNENVAVGTVVGVTALASDADASDTVIYSLSNDAGGLFAIDANTGIVTTTGAIDREAAASYNIEVTATSTDGSTSVQTYTINVNDVDEFDVTTPVDANAAANSVAEDAVNGAVVGVTASASDADATTNAITYSVVDIAGDPVVGGPFAVDTNSGVVTLADAAQIDYETATSHTLYIKAASADGSTSQESFTINVTDVNEAPVITSDGGGSTANINIDENTTGVTTVTANDPDAGDIVTYSITGGADAGLFTIDANTGALTFASAPDYENALDAGADNIYEVIVQSSDGTLTDSQTLSVTINDVNEAPTDMVFDGSSTVVIDTETQEFSGLTHQWKLDGQVTAHRQLVHRSIGAEVR